MIRAGHFTKTNVHSLANAHLSIQKPQPTKGWLAPRLGKLFLVASMHFLIQPLPKTYHMPVASSVQDLVPSTFVMSTCTRNLQAVRQR